MSSTPLAGTVLLVVAVASGAWAQAPSAITRPADQEAQRRDAAAVDAAPAAQPCEGCPRRRPLLAVAELAGINLFYNLVNRVLPTDFHDDFRVGPSTWARNIGHGFSWDNDPFVINQFGHPYQGSNYFSAGRANGLNYWESLPLTTLGSVMWEWLGESNHPAWNDVINSTLGGAAFGEALHRVAWLVRDPRQAGRARLWREIGATAIDPIGGLNRFAWRDALRPGDTPPTMRPGRAVAEVQVGASWQEGDLRVPGTAPRHAYGTFSLDYGALERGPARAPFDAFTMAVRVGGGATVSAASIRGRLVSRPIGSRAESTHQALLVQEYGFRETSALLFGEQSMLGGVADRFEVGPGISIATTALAGPVILGTIDSPAPQAEDRAFDYGPGATASGSADLTVRGTPVVRVVAAAWWLHTVTREPSDHVLSLVRIEGRVPIARGLHLLLEAERTTRSTREGNRQVRRAAYPEARAGLAWRFGSVP